MSLHTIERKGAGRRIKSYMTCPFLKKTKKINTNRWSALHNKKKMFTATHKSTPSSESYWRRRWKAAPNNNNNNNITWHEREQGHWTDKLQIHRLLGYFEDCVNRSMPLGPQKKNVGQYLLYILHGPLAGSGPRCVAPAAPSIVTPLILLILSIESAFRHTLCQLI